MRSLTQPSAEYLSGQITLKDGRSDVATFGSLFAPRVWAPLSMGAVALGAGSAYVFYSQARPMVSLDNGRTLVFDPIALVDATLIMMLIGIISWIPVYRFIRRTAFARSATLATVSTWLLSSVLIYWVDNMDGRLPCRCEIAERASRVLSDGQDLLFLPLVIPILSVLSGATYCGALWLSNRLVGKHD